MIEHFGHHFIHIIVFILCQTTTKTNITFGSSESLILLSKCIITVIVDRIIGFGAFMPLLGIFITYHRIRLLAKLEMLVLNNASIWGLTVSVVEHSVTLEVFYTPQQLMVKSYSAKFQLT